MRLNAILLSMGALLSLGACASTGATEGAPPTLVRSNEVINVDTGGIPPDKQAEILLVLQQRDASARKCYQDVLNEKKTREFKGTVKLMLSLGVDGRAQNVRVMGGTLGNKDVEDCLLETVREFEYPRLERPGDMQYSYTFEPQY